MRYVCLLALMVPILSAQTGADAGAGIYKERCASCHDSPAERVPSLQTIKAMSPEAIYMALTSGVMKSRAEGMQIAQIFALIGYIAPTGGTHTEPLSLASTCKSNPAFAIDPKSPMWNGWSPSLTNSRFQDATAAGLTAPDIPKLKLKWAFNLGDVTMTRAQPVVAGGRMFITSLTGAVFSLDASTGCSHWGFQAATGVRSGMTVGEANGKPAVFFSDQGSTLYALNARSGELLWKIRPAVHFTAMPTATPLFYKGVVYQAYSSFEEAIAADPSYKCCTARGSVVALDAATGKTIWQTFTVPEQLAGPSGAGVWSTPTIDERRGVLYVATGDNYSDPPTETSDAILAMEIKTGKLVWSRQLTANDVYTNGCVTPKLTNCPAAHGSDFDFGQPPILVQFGAGKRALVIGQKSGMVHAIDPDNKGKILWQTRAGAGSALGGSQWGSASDGQKVYVAISDLGIGGVPDSTVPQGFRLTLDPKKGGGLRALDPKTGKIVWSAKPIPCADTRTDCSPAQSAAVTATPGAVFSGSVDGHLRAYSASTGEVLWDTDTEQEFKTVNGKPAHGGSLDIAGPAVVNGMVFVNSGYGQWGGMPGNVLLAFSVDGK
jgi:polyvinyl alcohol dehydrogenase (cytochrome)